jgi:hypothetical protein
MGKLLTIGAFAAGCGAAYLLTRRESAATTGRTNVQDEAFRITLAELAAEKDSAKKAVLKAKLDAEVVRRKASEAEAEQRAKAATAAIAKAKVEAAARTKPLYPPGLLVKFGDISATITEAHRDAQGAWHYTTVISGTPLGIKDGTYPSSEIDLRKQLSEQLGQPLAADQAFPVGLQVYRNQQGGWIQKVERNAAGVWIYTVAGWGNTVNQSELLGILSK